MIVFSIEVPYPEFRKQEATYKLLRGWPEEFDAMIVVKTLICSVPFLLFFALRTYIRIVFLQFGTKKVSRLRCFFLELISFFPKLLVPVSVLKATL